MQKTSEVKIEYTVDLQKWFLRMMLADGQLYTRVANIINSQNFDKSLRPVVELFKESAEKYSTIPEPELIEAATGIRLEPIQNVTDGHEAKFLDEFEKFTKRQELERAILQAADMLEKGEYGPVEKLIKDAVQISLQKDIDRKSTRLNSSHTDISRMPSSA